MDLFFKSESHEHQTYILLNKLGYTDIFTNIEHGAFAYIVSATYKVEQIIKCIDNKGYIDLDMLHDMITVYSSSEKDMIHFALQCFNKNLSDITLAETMTSLDEDNNRVIKQAIKIRY